VNVPFTSAQAAGDLNVIVVSWNDSTATVSAVTDSKGNTYSRAVGPTVISGSLSQSIYYAKNIVSPTAGANTVTVTFSNAAACPDIRILEYSGVDPDNPIDVTAASSGSSTTSSSGTATTNNPADLIFGANIVATLTSGPGSSFTNRLLTAPDGDIAEDRMVTASGSYSATAPLSSSGPWIMQMVAFRARSSDTTSGLMGAYSFNEGSGTIVGDSSGNANTGTIVNATRTSSGKYGNALSFGGSAGYVDIGNPTDFQLTGSMTLSAWVFPTGNPPDDAQIIAKDSGDGWQLKTTSDTGSRTFGVAISNGTTHIQRYCKTVLSLNTWYFVAGVYNAASQTLDIYVNGVLDDGVLSGVVPASQHNSTVNLNVGRRTGGYWFQGVIDEVRVYKYPLSQTQVQLDMSTPLR
jgi:hypothetical protein